MTPESLRPYVGRRIVVDYVAKTGIRCAVAGTLSFFGGPFPDGCYRLEFAGSPAEITWPGEIVIERIMELP